MLLNEKPWKKYLVSWKVGIAKIFIFKLAKGMKHENQYIVGDKSMENDEG